MAKPPKHIDPPSSSIGSTHPGAIALSDLARLARREMRRSERTRTPLSLALFRIAIDPTAPSEGLARMWEIVCHNCRDTDGPCHGEDGTIVVLLFDTDLKGADAFLEKMLVRARGLSPSTVIQQYPGPLFQNLLGGERHPSNARPTAQRPSSAAAAASTRSNSD